MVGNTRASTRKVAFGRAVNVLKPVKKDKSSTLAVMKNADENMQTKKIGAKVKRVSQNSPKEAPQKKRSAFGDITNAADKKIPLAGKKLSKTTKSSTALSSKISTKQDAENTLKETTSSDKLKIKSHEISSSQETSSQELQSSQNKKEASITSFENDSLESNLSEDDLFKLSSDCLTSSQEIILNINSTADTVLLSDCSQKNDSQDIEASPNFTIPEVEKNLPEGVRDVDKDNDPLNFCEYAESIFKNLKSRERLFPVRKYLDGRKDVTPGMRAILIDWLVEVQENFELFHETLYLGVRIIDLYLQKKECKREKLQLIGASAMLIASKIEERYTPPLDDFVYVCDDAYQSSQFIKMEIDILATLDFELGLPISYRFLRRYSRVAGTPMETLTLARYILESSLLEYEFVDCSQSHIAAAALNLAFKMKKVGVWDKTLEYHTGYSEDGLKELVVRLNKMISAPAKKNLNTIRQKYSHPVFSEVAKIPTIKIEQ